MKRLVIFLSFILIAVFTFGQNLPRRAPFFGSEPIVKRYPHYRIRKGYDMWHTGWIVNDKVYVLSYDSTSKNVGDMYLYSRNNDESSSPLKKVNDEPIIKFYNKEDSYYSAGFRTMGMKRVRIASKEHWSDKEFTYRDTLKRGGGGSRVEYLKEWNTYLVLLHVSYGCGERKLDRYLFIVPIFFVPEGNGKYKAFAFEPKNFKPDWYYVVKGMGDGIKYDENRDEYSLGFYKGYKETTEQFRLYFDFDRNDNEIIISNNEKYESSTIH